MTPQQRIKWLILLKCAEWEGVDTPEIDINNIDDKYSGEEGKDSLWDAEYEIREGEVVTDIPCESSRHYESKSVAAKCPDGVWVGWTYWYGGGKHGEPEAMDWIGEAYLLNCEEREEVVTVREFIKVK